MGSRAPLLDTNVRQPKAVNAVENLCDRHARLTPNRPALIHVTDLAESRTFNFAQLADLSRRFATVLKTLGVVEGDRVALLLPQGPEMPIALFACWRIGAIAMPIPPVFTGPGLQHRLVHSGSRAIVTGKVGCGDLAPIRDQLGELSTIWSIDSPASDSERSFWADIARAAPLSDRLPSGGLRPSHLMYTSGTTGRAKGAIHTHRGLNATIAAGALVHHDMQSDDIAWTPAAWSWIAGFSGLLLYMLDAGLPVIAWEAPHPFDPERVFAFLSKHRVRNTLLTPTMLRMLGGVASPQLSLRTMLCTGEAINADLSLYCKEQLQVTPCEAYGQTECAPIAVNNPVLMPERLGALGRPVPEMTLAVLGSDQQELGPGERGEICVRRDHASVFKGYWQDPETTGQKLRGDWLMTGDEGWFDEDGFYWFVGRNDDVIKSSGYRIGPGEIEACLARHPAVELVAAFGLADQARGTRVVVAVKLRPAFTASEKLADELIAFGRQHLERHECPKRVLFIDDMPLTATGKVMRKEVRQLFASESSSVSGPTSRS